MNSEEKNKFIADIRKLAEEYGLTLKKLADAVNAIAYAEMFKKAKEHVFEEGTWKANEVNNNG